LTDWVAVGIPATEVRIIWPKVINFIELALKRGQGEWAAEDILAALLVREMQLWVAYEGDCIKAAGVTQVVYYPQKRVCDFLLAGGTGLRFWLKRKSLVLDWAKQQGCSHVRIFGRDGWGRVLGWKKAYSVFVGEIA